MRGGERVGEGGARRFPFSYWGGEGERSICLLQRKETSSLSGKKEKPKGNSPAMRKDSLLIFG